ncbi:MAG: hypothetical protein WBK51_13995 [Polaromonas sp.]
MEILTLTASEFSRGLFDFLHQAQHQKIALNIPGNKSHMWPAVVKPGFPISQLDDLLATGPHLATSDRQEMTSVMRKLRNGSLRNIRQVRS